MTTRLAPWQRLNVALARGILLQASGHMKWMANVCVLGSDDIEGGRRFAIWPIEADSERDAARAGALSVAKTLYGDRGETSWSFGGNATWLVSIGVYQGQGRLKGRSVEVKVERIDENEIA